MIFSKLQISTSPPKNSLLMRNYLINGKRTPDLSLMGTMKDSTGKPFGGRVLSRVFSEDYDVVEKIVLDPRGTFVDRWNKVFLLACLISLFVDPLFFYLPVAYEEACIDVSVSLEVTLTVIRSLVDAFYIVQIVVRFRTAFVAPSSRVFGRGELVIDPSKIASRYLHKDFWLHLIAAIPLPQVLIWAAIPSIRDSEMTLSSVVLRFLIIFQYLLRLYLIFPLSSQIVKANGVVMATAWAGAAYNLMLYMLASHVLGSCWYLLSLQRQHECWKKVCSLQQQDCKEGFFSCRAVNETSRNAWFKTSNISILCGASTDFFQFGIYSDALTVGVTATSFLNKYYYCLWWGLRNLSSLGQNLFTSTYIGEINFAVIIAILGLVLFALLIGNMQMYLQSTMVRLEEWMRHRQLPQDLKQRVRRYEQYKWVATRGVDGEAVLKGLPMDLRRDIKRHLCLDLVRQVPLFDQMDDRMLDAICERLKPYLCTPRTCLVREGDPVIEMLFIVRGRLNSYTTNGGRTGFFNSCCIGAGDFCGEELLTWALDPRPNVLLPSSTRTVEAITEVEAFALISEDLKFVAAQFRRLHSKQLRHTFRFYSHQWRTWAACFIQAAWFRYKRHKEAAELKKREILKTSVPKSAVEESTSLPPHCSGLTIYAAKLAASTRRGGSMRRASEFDILSSLQKPVEPDFTIEDR
ncbi:protein CNGC15b-like isoform X1 [Juglans microcarpa x Juglans regia]|uniref:protein CNGC15b-like isoform X1 n=1 Tax=Juglans microcarpa x Juglans regia TaxID=2249226 RepID=UPI001B7E945E|nr:protein CNGC15b-like isoform X1 [Juglans microcarpa x Juglans regia]